MTSNHDAVVGVLHTSKVPLDAKEIGRRSSISTRDVNSVLYEGVGVDFVRTRDPKPRWSLLSQVLMANAVDSLEFVEFGSQPLVMSHQDELWEFFAQQVCGSRNDPPYTIEFVGPRQAMVSVNVAFVGGELRGASASQKICSEQAQLILGFAVATHQVLARIGVNSDSTLAEYVLRDVLLHLAQVSTRSQSLSTD